jgi:hypothetical protein
MYRPLLTVNPAEQVNVPKDPDPEKAIVPTLEHVPKAAEQL